MIPFRLDYLALAAISLSAASCTMPEDAQVPDADSDDWSDDSGTPFQVGDELFDSQADFVNSGGRCATDLDPEKVAAIEAEQQLMPEFDDFYAGETSGSTRAVINVPVYVHVLTRGAGEANGELPASAITNQIQAMNDSYGGLGITFTLMDTDYTNNATWYKMRPGTTAQYNAQSSLHEGGADSLNIYFCKPTGGYLGWSSLPSEYAAHPTRDGIVILNTTYPGGAGYPYNEGLTAVHEAGHWLGLYHTFQGGCGATGDSVADTEKEKTANYGCPASRDTCAGGGGDPIHNFMDYSDDDCMWEFTAGQGTRIESSWAAYR